ncbi:MAG: IS5/IS1182 family transposase [Blastopirellula sp.]|nr:MAG: IS5/IS1182 family transposase [Blastopirellula sp.]
MSKSIQQQRGNARSQMPERRQVEMQFLSLDQWLDKDHRVRTVWSFVETLDLSELYQSIKATRNNVGRDPIDPRILFALWLFATIEGTTSARRIAELTTRDIPYMWICGGVSVNYHRVSDFRTEHGDLLERVLTDSIAVLIHQDLINLNTVAQDGMRVRASAGSGSFRRAASLEEARQRAQTHVEELKKQHEIETDGGDKRRQAAQKRAAREKLERIEQAQVELADMQEKYDKRSGKKRSEPRASTTDPEARRTKMSDRGNRPAMNVQFASDGDAQMIISVDVTSQGSDSGLMQPMFDDVCERYGQVPDDYLVDGGYSKKDDITHAEKQGSQVYAPLYAEEKLLAAGEDPYAARPKESSEMTEHRQRMGTDEAKEKYKRRMGIAEFPNADCRNRGLYQFRVRGRAKAKAQTLWHALAFNFMRMRNLICPLRKMSYLEVVMAN